MIIYSPFILSNALIGLICLALFDIQLDSFKFRLHPNLINNWKGFWRNPSYWLTTLLFIAVLLSCFMSTDMDYSLERLKLKIPFLALPFAFYALPRLSTKSYQMIFTFLVFVLFVTNLGIGINYILHFDEINEKIMMGQAIPTPRNHVRYSLLLCIGILSGIVLAYRRAYIRYPIERWLMIGMTIFNFIFIHILSVRSGLVILYLTILLASLATVFFERKILLGTISLLGIILLPILAYYTMPSFSSKVNYVNWELHEYAHGRSPAGSDQGRLQSIVVGWEVFKKHPILGVGAGDFKTEIHNQFSHTFPKADKKLMPHNQFLSVAVGTGIVGLLVFMLAIFYPFLIHGHFRDPFYFIFFLTFLLSFLVENTIENSIGIGFYVLFLGICLSHLTNKKVDQQA